MDIIIDDQLAEALVSEGLLKPLYKDTEGRRIYLLSEAERKCLYAEQVKNAGPAKQREIEMRCKDITRGVPEVRSVLIGQLAEQ